MSLIPNLTDEEKAWSAEHGCIHGLYPDEDPIFCPNCKPDPTEIFKILEARCKNRNETQAKDI